MKISNEDTYAKLSKDQKAESVFKEIIPFFLLALIPIAITLMIAKVFGPSF